jgi:mannose-6-phosphate isomerase-like protein (cupin superfamily)
MTTQDTRPWGSEEIFTTNESTTVKILTINPGEECSLQYHNHRKEFWKVIEGEAILQIGDNKIDAALGSEYEIPVGTQHRIIGKDKPGKILEISYGEFDENDIVRLEDKYGRLK